MKEATRLYPTLTRAIDGFLLAKSASGLSANTIRNYKTDLLRFTAWLGDKPIDKISSKHLEKFIQYLREDFRITRVATTDIEPKKLSSKSIRNTWATLSSFWKWVSKEFDIPNPFNVPHVKAHTKPIDPLHIETIEKLLQACDSCTKKSKSSNSYCNPNHLFLGTNQDNVNDKVDKGRQLVGEKNGNSKLTDKDVVKIRELHRVKKIPYRKLGSMFGVSSSTVMGIVKGDYWKLPLAE